MKLAQFFFEIIHYFVLATLISDAYDQRPQYEPDRPLHNGCVFSGGQLKPPSAYFNRLKCFSSIINSEWRETVCTHSELISSQTLRVRQEIKFLIQRTNPVFILRLMTIFRRICIFTELKAELKSTNKTQVSPLGCISRVKQSLVSIMCELEWIQHSDHSGSGFTQYQDFCEIPKIIHILVPVPCLTGLNIENSYSLDTVHEN